jgi:hypothetical protein
MPNWCSNSVILKHKDHTFIARARQAAEKDGLLNEFIPVPKDLKETISGYMGDDEEQKQLEIQQAYNIKNYGYANWYDFCVNEWGTKWDVTGEVEDYDGGILIYFDSAWAPPIGAYEKLKSMGFDIQATYYEPGCAFVGEWLDGEDYCYQIEGNSEWVRENIPEHLDDAYAISESMAQWEEEANEEE